MYLLRLLVYLLHGWASDIKTGRTFYSLMQMDAGTFLALRLEIISSRPHDTECSCRPVLVISIDAPV